MENSPIWDIIANDIVQYVKDERLREIPIIVQELYCILMLEIDV
jgi:hypothetical protein